MSYDVYIGENSHNYTSNMSDLFNEIIKEDNTEIDDRIYIEGIHVLNGMLGYQALTTIKDALQKASSHENIEDFDIHNGWGTAHGGLMFLARIAIDCAITPYETVRVHY